MTQELLTALYIAASVLFILSLGGLSDQEKAKKSCLVWYHWNDHSYFWNHSRSRYETR